MLLIILFNNIYEISKYINNHPGEGIRDTYLKNYNLKNGSIEFDKYHCTDEPFKLLEDSKNKKFCNVNNIYYVCPNFFKNRIPKYFKFFENYEQAELFISSNNNKYVIFQSFTNNDNQINFYWKFNNNINKSIIYYENDVWNLTINEINLSHKYIENILSEFLNLINI